MLFTCPLWLKLRIFRSFSHPCCDAEVVSHGLDCSTDHRNSPVVLEYCDRVVRVPQVLVVKITVVISQLQLVVIAVRPVYQMVQVSQTSESLGAARVVVDMPVGVPTCGSSSTGS